MSDLDEELLDMVGGDSEDESVDDLDRLDEVDADEDREPSQEAKQSVEKTEEPQANRRGVAQKVKARRGGRRRKQESEDEDADGSPERDLSLGSGGMDESDGELDAPGEAAEEGTQYVLEGKFTSVSDREHVMSLPEIEREAILAERAEEEQRRRQDAVLKQALAKRDSAASRIKRKAEAAELDEDNNRRATRPKTNKRSALDDYKRAREQKGADRDRRDAARDRRDERSPSSTSDRDADGESEVEWAEPSSESRSDPPPELKDFERCRVGRSNFAKVCFYPGFEDAIKGCFARLSIGINRETGQNQYRMAQIKGFTEGKSYQMESANGKRFTVDQYAIVAQGPHEKKFPFAACSDGRFTDSEFARFTETLRKENMRVPPKKFFGHKLDAIHGLINTQFTEETLQQKFAKQRAVELKHDPVHIAKQKRKDIAQRRAEAEQNGDEEEIQRCDDELEALDNGASASNGAVKVKPSPSKAMHTDRLAQLNQANRHKNTQEVRQALIAERKKHLKAREDAAKAKREAEHKANLQVKAQQNAAKKEMNDLFGETPDISRAGTPANGTDTPKKSRPATPLATVKKGPVGALKQKSLDDDVIGGLDLGIDLEI